jgi:hypothetical protein
MRYSSVSKVARLDQQAAFKVHEALQKFAVREAKGAIVVGRLLLEARQQQVHMLLGHSSFYEYAERVLSC